MINIFNLFLIQLLLILKFFVQYSLIAALDFANPICNISTMKNDQP